MDLPDRTFTPVKQTVEFAADWLALLVITAVARFRHTAGQSITEFIIVLPVLLIMLSSVLFFADMLVLKERSIIAVRYSAWQAGRNGGSDPSPDSIKALFFRPETQLSVAHPAPQIGLAGTSLGEFGSLLGQVAGINGTALRVQGRHYPLLKLSVTTGARHSVVLDTWKESSVTGKALKYSLWAIAVAEGFQNSSSNGNGSGSNSGGDSGIDLENPSILGN